MGNHHNPYEQCQRDLSSLQYSFYQLKEEIKKKENDQKTKQEIAEKEFKTRVDSYSTAYIAGYLNTLKIKVRGYMEYHFEKYDSHEIKSRIHKIGLEENALEIIKDKIKEEASQKSIELSAPIEHYNIIICGKTGIGKSTLINEILQLENNKQSSTGVGKPITKGAPKVYESNKLQTLRLYDSQGIELKNHDVETTIQEIEKLIETKAKEKNADRFIHGIWYCIGVPGCRIEDSEKEAIQQLKKIYNDDKLPIIIVLTQAYDNKDVKLLTQIIKEEINKNIPIIPVVAQEKYNCSPFGFEELIEITFNQSIKSTNSAILYSLQLELANKLKESRKNAQESLNLEILQKVSLLQEKYQTILSDEEKKENIFNFYVTILLDMFSIKQKLTITSKKSLYKIIAKYFMITNEILNQFINEQLTEQALVLTNNYITCKLDVEASNNILISNTMTMEKLNSLHVAEINAKVMDQVNILFQKEGFNKMIESFIEDVQKESYFLYEECIKDMSTILQNITHEAMINKVQELQALTNNPNQRND